MYNEGLNQRWLKRAYVCLVLGVAIAGCYVFLSKSGSESEGRKVSGGSVDQNRKGSVLTTHNSKDQSNLKQASGLVLNASDSKDQSNGIDARNKGEVNQRQVTPKPFDLMDLGNQGLVAMAVSLDYWEQTACALDSLFDLQCWASTVNISKVVKPMLKTVGSSVFHFRADKSSLNFEDVFDLEHWNNLSLGVGYSPLVSQEYFMQHASRDIVYVQVKYGSWVKCKSTSEVSSMSWYKSVFTSRGFHVVKTVCSPRSITPEAFWKQIFSNVNPRNVSVIFDMWQGIGTTFRLILKGSQCVQSKKKLGSLAMSTLPSSKLKFKYAPTNSTPRFIHSKRILKYIDTFLSEHVKDRRYIAIMLRTEKLFNKKYTSTMKQSPDKNPCAKNVLSDWKSMKEKINISNTLFFSDIGSHGSGLWSSSSAKRFSQYVHDQLHLKMSFRDVNSAFERITGSKNSVQIAALNQELVAQATCAVIVGGGSFQGMTFSMYAHNHKGQECYTVRDGMCEILYTSSTVT